MGRLTHKQQEKLIKIFNAWGFFPDKLVQNISWKEYGNYVKRFKMWRLGHE
jgi:hypothetical protein